MSNLGVNEMTSGQTGRIHEETGEGRLLQVVTLSKRCDVESAVESLQLVRLNKLDWAFVRQAMYERRVSNSSALN